jgi:predicted AlkP superfamily pyrophosphatase or phosphodiesterase
MFPMRFEAWSRAALAVVLLALGFAAPHLHAQAGAPAPPHRLSSRNNSAQAQAQHYLVLVSLDGFRWDYAQRDDAGHLLALGKQGAWAPEGMLPSYPAMGVPNRFTIVTGLYPGHHGLVADSFYDPDRKARFSASDAKDLADGTWFGGVPLWSLAENQGMRAAVMGWPGGDAEIAGARPSYAVPSCSDVQARKCVEQVLEWLRLPAPERPHFIAIDYSGPAAEARRFGPDAPEVKTAVRHADELVGRLKTGLDAAGLPVNLVVVSDRGLAKTDGGWITLDQFTSLAGFETVDVLLYAESEQERQRVYRQLNHVSSLFFVYRRKDLPPNLHMNMIPRIGDPVVIASGPYAIRAHAPAAGQADPPPPAGVDDMDPQSEPQMRAIFFAAGPDIAQGKTVGPFENVNLYPWMTHILGLKPPKSDGSLNILAGTLRDDGLEPGGEAKK